MLYLEIKGKEAPKRHIDHAIAVLQRGGLVVFPTDTGYAIGCDLYKKKSIERIYKIKKRDSKKPLSFICQDLTSLSQYALMTNQAYRSMKKLLPGPFTFVLPATRMVPKLLVSRNSTVGIRIPDHPVSQALVKALQHPIIVTSCTTPDDKPLEHVGDIKECYAHQVDAIMSVDALAAEPSTVVDYTQAKPRVLRKGKGDVSLIGLEDHG